MSTILIIGGSAGIGQSLVQSLASNPDNVIFASYSTGEHLIQIENVHYFQYNVLEEWVTPDNFPDQLDGFVYCPGAIDLKPFPRMDANAFMADYNLQVGGAIRSLQGVLNALRKSPMASVVFFSTVAVQSGFPFHTKVAASKGAIEGLTKSLAAEYAPKIRFNAIAPSLTNTPLAAGLVNTEAKIEANGQRHPMKRIGEPVDIAQTAEFLLSEKATWITGQILHVDGGMSTLKVG
jgi:NAD(P)-dependent dehydrogenase (short-subunit alcohol dehydrogenase family)